MTEFLTDRSFRSCCTFCRFQQLSLIFTLQKQLPGVISPGVYREISKNSFFYRTPPVAASDVGTGGFFWLSDFYVELIAWYGIC